jgi:hypothetical protein
VVVVVTMDHADSASFRQDVVVTPSRRGAVRIVAAQAPLVRLRAASGATFTLDVAARRFV